MAKYEQLQQHVETSAEMLMDGTPAIVLTMHLGTACAIASITERVAANPASDPLAQGDARALDELSGLIRKQQHEYLKGDDE